MPATVTLERQPPLLLVTINRPGARNAVDGPTAAALAAAFRDFDADPELAVAILAGGGEHFCAGADLKAVAGGDPARANRLSPEGDGPMGPTRLRLSKPVIAAVSGYCVAGGLELALWCDLRVADETAVFGVFCRRFGVPLIDGGTVRLPRAIGMSRAMDMILTGRPVEAQEALQMGLANRVVPAGQALAAARELALQVAAFPQACLRGDRLSAFEQWGLAEQVALDNEFAHGMKTLQSGETVAGATRFSQGAGRHGEFGESAT
ncbi:MAG: crotonase/enoyl-CoA hydratase family protein [Moraxellaceae bacterium]|jgi:enoyl-CoA hydratase|nr:crotonase/enoyl-CoA hydratase family protein [Moraxellaceae bacterium]